MGRRLRAGLETLRDRHRGEIADVRGLGLLLGLQLDAGGRSASRRRSRAVARVDTIVARARARGIHLLSTSDGTGLLFTPAFTVTPRQIDRLVDVLDRSFAR